jgi:hypothetical protein
LVKVYAVFLEKIIFVKLGLPFLAINATFDKLSYLEKSFLVFS